MMIAKLHALPSDLPNRSSLFFPSALAGFLLAFFPFVCF